jgi:hypothetical protein
MLDEDQQTTFDLAKDGHNVVVNRELFTFKGIIDGFREHFEVLANPEGENMS